MRRDPPDLILLDLQMPRLDGMGVLEVLHRERSEIPVILMTFHGSEDIAVEVFRMGVRDYLKKPYTAEEMLNAIERSLAEVRLRREKEALTTRLMNANRELHIRIKELNTLYSIGKSVAALLDLQQLLVRIVDAAISLTNAEQARLLLVETNALTLRALKLRGDPSARSTTEVVQDRLAERAVSTARPLVLNAQQLEPLRQMNPAAPYAALYVPLLIGNAVIGVLNVENLTQGARQFTDNDAALLSALGDYAAIALEKCAQLSRPRSAQGAQSPVSRHAQHRWAHRSAARAEQRRPPRDQRPRRRFARLQRLRGAANARTGAARAERLPIARR